MSRSALLDSSPTAPSGPAGHVLFITPDAARAASLARAIGQGVDHVPDELAALGHVAAFGAPRFVLAQLALVEDAPATVRALRDLCPGAALIALGRSDQTDAARAAGFDDLMLESASTTELAQHLTPSQKAGNVSLPGFSPGFSPGSLPGSPTPPLPTTPAPTADPHDLGDVDIISQLLQRTGQTLATALCIAQVRSEFPQLSWCKSQHEVPPHHAAHVVEHQGFTFGLLHAPPPATAAQLAPWAHWLAHWLSLERRMDQLWELSLKDELTGAWNRRYFERFLRAVLQRAGDERFRVTLMVYDIDDFKHYNDRYGHAAGDEILRETSRLMRSVVREHDVVARVGGDEFAVIFWDAQGPRKPDSAHPTDAVKAARRFQKAICDHKFPKLADDAKATLTISGGLASFPWDGRTAEELLQRADEAAIHSKRQGKNAVTLGPGARRACATDPTV